MYRRLHNLVRSSPGPTVNAPDLEDVHEYLQSLRPILRDGHGEAQVSFAVVELVNAVNGHVVGHITWDGEREALRFRPSVPEDTQPLPIQHT